MYDELPKKLLRSAVIGFCASAISGAWPGRRRAGSGPGGMGPGRLGARGWGHVRRPTEPGCFGRGSAACSCPPPPDASLPPSLPADTVSNSIRVVKTTKQTASVPMTYPEVVRVRWDGSTSRRTGEAVFGRPTHPTPCGACRLPTWHGTRRAPQLQRDCSHSLHPVSMQLVVKDDGVLGLMGRGLKTKILSNGLQVCGGAGGSPGWGTGRG